MDKNIVELAGDCEKYPPWVDRIIEAVQEAEEYHDWSFEQCLAYGLFLHEKLTNLGKYDNLK